MNIYSEVITVPSMFPFRNKLKYKINPNYIITINNLTYKNIYPPNNNEFYVNYSTNYIYFNELQKNNSYNITYQYDEVYDNSPLVSLNKIVLNKSYKDPDYLGDIGNFHINVITKHVFIFIDPNWIDISKTITELDYQPLNSLLTSLSNLSGSGIVKLIDGQFILDNSINISIDVSTDVNNRLIKGTDNNLYVPEFSGMTPLYTYNLAKQGLI